MPPTNQHHQLVPGTYRQQLVRGTFWLLVLAFAVVTQAQVVEPVVNGDPITAGTEKLPKTNRKEEVNEKKSSKVEAKNKGNDDKSDASKTPSKEGREAEASKDAEDVRDTKSSKDAEASKDAETSQTDAKAATAPAAQRERLLLSDVVASLYRSYPSILAARLEPARAGGELVSAYGAFDTKLYGGSIAEPTGFYRNYRSGLGVARQSWWGGYLSAGYRLGRGVYQPWYLERETEKGGEFKVGWVQPMLQGRAIDANRVAVFQASLAQQAAAPIQQQAILDAARDAANIYWDWVAVGAMFEAQKELLKLAELRGEQFEEGFKAGKFAEIDVIFNRALIADRKTKVIETEQKFRATSFKLSLFLRDEVGQPLIPDDQWLPDHFPIIENPPIGDFQTDLNNALARRPEPRLLQLEIQHVNLDRRLAQNNLLPSLDFISEASQDVGDPGSRSNDKGDFELVVGVQGEVPIQRRKARGKIQSTSAKISQIEEKLRLQRDKIGTELQTAYNALQLSTRVVEQAEISLRAAFESLDRYRFAFERGKADLIYLNLLETKANETELKLVDAQRGWFSSLANMQAALGLDPLDQAIQVSSLPLSERPGPGDLPNIKSPDPDVLDRDWKLHSAPRE